ncbi:putative purine permease 4 [Canna indica]|uniref:Purine permease 4 n=1 Tax=Canna indica TaxID=4628 RepID=A0AAQ3KK18_9LILI|nr:putative purine permease 4 [Canna indica]
MASPTSPSPPPPSSSPPSSPSTSSSPPSSSTNLNCVLLLSLSSVLLGLNSDHERPPGVTKLQYVLGFLATLGATTMYAVYLPLAQIVYRGVTKFRMVMEMQVVMEAAATAFALVGMAAGGGRVRADVERGGGGVQPRKSVVLADDSGLAAVLHGDGRDEH